MRADLPNGWSDLHVFRMLLYSHFLNSSTSLRSSVPSDSKLNLSCVFFFFSCLPNNTYNPLFPLFLSAIAPDFSQNLLKAQTLARQGGDVLIECKPRMSPRGVISWRKGKEALRESHRYPVSLCRAVIALCAGPRLFSLSALLAESYFIDLLFYFSLLYIHGDKQRRTEPQCDTIQFELHNTFCTPPLSPCYLHFFPQLHCPFLSWLCSEQVSALFT